MMSVKYWMVVLVLGCVAQRTCMQGVRSTTCDCGFVDERGRIWSEIWYANYMGYSGSLQKDPYYLVMNYTVPAKRKNTMDRVFDPNNVKVTNQDGVELTVQRESDGQYTCASFGTRRQDFFYGTFRVHLKTSPVPGTVAAFYFFRNNTCEIDMESLSRIQNPWKTYLTVHPQIYNANGEASNITNNKYTLSFNPTTNYHQYRFDWVPGEIVYYIDGDEANRFDQIVPNAPGRVIMNHWTDGNPSFSGPPPTKDASMYVANLTIFFNSTEATGLPACQNTKTPCKVSDIMSRKLIPSNNSGENSSSTNGPIPSSVDQDSSSPAIAFSLNRSDVTLLLVTAIIFTNFV